MISGKNKEELMKALGDRYGRGKSIIYEWFKILGISAFKSDGEWHISEDNLAKLDRYNQWLEQGNKTADFPELQTAIAVSSNNGIEEAAIPLETNQPLPEEFQQLIRVGQEKGAGLLIAQNMLAQQFAANPELLAPDLLQQVRESERAIAPKSQDPKQYAKRFMQIAQNNAAA